MKELQIISLNIVHKYNKYMKNKQKKLLILGGNALSCDIVTTAQKMGLYTIVTDWYSEDKSPAKKIADEAWNVSIEDYEELAKRIKDQGIDGVFTNYTDSYLIPYVKLCNIVDLPCLATEDQINTITNKDQSKKLCETYGISVSKAYDVNSIDDLDKLVNVKYPVILKPVDQSGQRGIIVCNNLDELKQHYMESLKFSASGKVLVEEYLKGDYVVMFYTVQNGIVSLASMADKPVAPILDPNQVRLPMAYILPSQYVGLCRETVLPKVQDFVTGIGLKNGVIGIEGIVKDKEISVFEMQFRLGGMRHHEFVLQENGMNIMEMLIRFAVTGEFSGWNAKETDNADFKSTYLLLNIFVSTGKISKVSGVENLSEYPYVTKVTQMAHEGDEILLPSTVQQIFCKVSAKIDNQLRLQDVIKQLYDTPKVKNERGEDMIVNYWL